MGYKMVCLNCFSVENLGTNFKNFPALKKCPVCSEKMVFMDHKFEPPKKTERKQWEVIKFLFSKGFIFQHIYGEEEHGDKCSKKRVKYPKTLKEAKVFVMKYKKQSIKST